MKRGLSPFFIFLLFVMVIPHTSVSAFQTDLWPLSDDMRIVSYPYPPCGETMDLTERPFYTWENSTHLIKVAGPVLVNCRGTENFSILINNTYDITFQDYILLKNRTMVPINATATIINVTVKTKDKEYSPIELWTDNTTLEYLPYNSTYELVVMNFTNLVLPWGSVFDLAYGSRNPQDYGWPVNMTIKMLINKRTGEGYLIDNGSLKYVGDTPFWSPLIKPENFAKMILDNAQNLIDEIKSNPWVVEQVLNKANKAKNLTERSNLIYSLAEKMTGRILVPKLTYLGRAMYLYSDFINATSEHAIIPGFNASSGDYVYLPQFGVPINHTFCVKTNATWISIPEQINGIPVSNYTRKALIDYTHGDSSELMELLRDSLLKQKVYLPSLMVGYGDKWAVVALDLPMDINKTGVFVVPLPTKYVRAFNASYLLVEPGTVNRFHVKYDPSFFTPDEVVEEWQKVGNCYMLLRNNIENTFLEILDKEGSSGFNASEFESIYPLLEKQLHLCGFNVTPTENSLSRGNSTSQSHPMSSPATSSNEKKKDICGPAFLVPLALIPAWLWRKRR